MGRGNSGRVGRQARWWRLVGPVSDGGWVKEEQEGEDGAGRIGGEAGGRKREAGGGRGGKR